MPELPGRLIAQALPGMIASARQKVSSAATTPESNPRKKGGSQFHPTDPDWGETGQMRELTICDSICIGNWARRGAHFNPLTWIREAVKPGSFASRSCPEQGTHPWAARFSDIHQTGACASGERTEREWGASSKRILA